MWSPLSGIFAAPYAGGGKRNLNKRGSIIDKKKEARVKYMGGGRKAAACPPKKINGGKETEKKEGRSRN